MKTQHVFALPSNASLPPVEGLPNGYAVIKDGRTWVVRSGQWVKGIADPSPVNPIPPDPLNPPPDPDNPPPPSLVTLPTSNELGLYRQSWGTAKMLKYSKYKPVPYPTSVRWEVEVSSGSLPDCVVSADGKDLLVRRPGYYQVELRTTLGTIPVLRRVHVTAVGRTQWSVYHEATGPSGGRVEALHYPGQLRAEGGATIHCPDPNDDPYYGNGGGALQLYLEDEMLAGMGALPRPYEFQIRLTPIIFTGPANMPINMPVILNADAPSWGYFFREPEPGGVTLGITVLAVNATMVRCRRVNYATKGGPEEPVEESFFDDDWTLCDPQQSPNPDGSRHWYGNMPWIVGLSPIGNRAAWEVQVANSVGRVSQLRYVGSLDYPS